jgi:beta-lactam-binding protein with PASTA domain
MPNVRGMFWDSVQPLLASLHWTGSLVKSPDVPHSGHPPGTVVTQTPDPGQHVPDDVVITLSFAAATS